MPDDVSQIRRSKSQPRHRSRVNSLKACWLQRTVLKWFEKGRRSFAWRRRRTPYRVLMAELMLRRTRADQVEPVFKRFVKLFPNVPTLACAKPSVISPRVEASRIGVARGQCGSPGARNPTAVPRARAARPGRVAVAAGRRAVRGRGSAMLCAGPAGAVDRHERGAGGRPVLW